MAGIEAEWPPLSRPRLQLGIVQTAHYLVLLVLVLLVRGGDRVRVVALGEIACRRRAAVWDALMSRSAVLTLGR